MNIENACIAGCRLIQLRLKDISFEDYKQAAILAKGICIQFGAVLIINDNAKVALEAKADGIHVGKNDLPPNEVRKLAPNLIVGGTANTLEDCLALIEQQVDYIGLGPFRFTGTKKELSPILGLEGYHSILSNLQTLGHLTPVYAIGGILPSDAAGLYATGIYGLAISGVMTGKPQIELQNIYDSLQPKKETV